MLVVKRQFGVVAHLRLCASALLRHGRTSLVFVSSLCTHQCCSLQVYTSLISLALVTDASTPGVAQDRAKNIAHLHGSGDFRLNAAMTTEQDYQRLGIAERATHVLQEQLQRVSAGHQAAHEVLQSIYQEMRILRYQIDLRSRIRFVESKSLMPDRFGKKNGPSWRTWSYLARDFVVVVHTMLKQAMKNAENRKQPIAATNLQHDFGATNDMDHELQHFLISRTKGEALEVVRGADREPCLEQWRRLAALYDQVAAGRSLDDSRQIFSTEGCQNRRLLARHPSLGKPSTTTSRTHWRPVTQTHATCHPPLHVSHRS